MDQYFTLFVLAEWALMQSFHHLDHYWDHEIVPEMDFKELKWVGKSEAKRTYFIYNIGDKEMILVSHINIKGQDEKLDHTY